MDDMALSMQVIKSSQQKLEQRLEEIAREASVCKTACERGQGFPHRRVHET